MTRMFAFSVEIPSKRTIMYFFKIVVVLRKSSKYDGQPLTHVEMSSNYCAHAMLCLNTPLSIGTVQA